MAKQKHRTIRRGEFRRQFEEKVIGRDGLVKYEIDDENAVYFRVPITLADDEEDDYAERVHAAGRAEGVDPLARVLLGEYAGASADEQLALLKKCGVPLSEFVAAVGKEIQDAMERMQDFRYRG